MIKLLFKINRKLQNGEFMNDGLSVLALAAADRAYLIQKAKGNTREMQVFENGKPKTGDSQANPIKGQVVPARTKLTKAVLVRGSSWKAKLTDAQVDWAGKHVAYVVSAYKIKDATAEEICCFFRDNVKAKADLIRSMVRYFNDSSDTDKVKCTESEVIEMLCVVSNLSISDRNLMTQEVCLERTAIAPSKIPPGHSEKHDLSMLQSVSSQAPLAQRSAQEAKDQEREWNWAYLNKDT